jgi:hypothetical protein
MSLDFDPKKVVAAMVERGFCSAPKFEPPLSEMEYRRRKASARGTTTHGTQRQRGQSTVPGVSERIVVFLSDFLRAQPGPFTRDDFKYFLDRSELIVCIEYVGSALGKFVAAGKLTRLTSGHRGAPAQYAAPSSQTPDPRSDFSAPANGTSRRTNRQASPVEGANATLKKCASMPARTLLETEVHMARPLAREKSELAGKRASGARKTGHKAAYNKTKPTTGPANTSRRPFTFKK